MEEEGVLPGNVALGQQLVEQIEPPAQGLAEAGLLPFGHLADEVVLADELGVGVAHRLHGGVDQGAGDVPLQAEEAGVAVGPADHAFEHIAAALVAGKDSVGHEEGHGPPVVGQDP